MSLTVYRQSKAFAYLSRFNIVRCAVCTGGIATMYTLGKRLSRSKESETLRTYGNISVHYSKFCGSILWGHILATSAIAFTYSRIKNLPRAVFLQKGFVYGERMGFGSMLVYLVSKEISGREWFAQIWAGGYTGLKYSTIQGLRGWQVYHSTRYGIYAGCCFFALYSLCGCLSELWQIFSDPTLTYSQWDDFDLEEYFYRIFTRFFNLDGWTRYIESRDVEEAIIACRREMNELEELAREAGLTPSDYLYVDVEGINERMFQFLDEVKTGRPQYDNVYRTETTVLETKFRQFDPHYEHTSSQRLYK